MEITKVKYSDLKVLPGSPVKSEDVPESPITIVNQNNEILFGFNIPTDEYIEVIKVNASDSRWLSLALHQVGLTCKFNCYEYLNTSKKDLGIDEEVMPIDSEMLDKWCKDFVTKRDSVNESEFNLF